MDSVLTVDRLDGNTRRRWHTNGRLHRIGGPASHIVTPSGVMVAQWAVEGVTHRVDGPAHQSFDPAHGTYGEIWKINGKRHRVDGPATVSRAKDGTVQLGWFKNDLPCRAGGGPTRVTYTPEGDFTVKWEGKATISRCLAGPYTVVSRRDGFTAFRWADLGHGFTFSLETFAPAIR